MKKIIDEIKIGTKNTNNSETLLVSVICIFFGGTIYGVINYFLQTNSFIIETFLNLIIIVLLEALYFWIKGQRNN